MRTLFVMALVTVALGVGACHHRPAEGPMQSAGHAVDDAAHDTKDAVKDAAHDVKRDVKRDR